jgi:uncharacterized protein (TIGR00255 family)
MQQYVKGRKMIKSMTGFGRSEYSDEKRNIVVEVKAVNHRFSDITVKMPRRYSFAEEKLKSIVKDIAKRGKVEVSVLIDNLSEDDVNVRLNIPAARQYYKNLIELKQEFSLEGGVSLSLLSGFPDVMKAIPDIYDEEAIIECLSLPVREAVAKLDLMRIAEGAKLAEDIVMRGKLILSLAERIADQAPQTVQVYKTRLQERISDLLGSSLEIPEDRIALEAAIFADKSNITEELVRLSSHISQLEHIVTMSKEPDGKKLDFLVQEMNREANTIGSKANDITITNYVLEIKSEIEKIREQIQNIE